MGGKKFTNFRVNLEGLESEARWYIIVTQYNYEQKVANDINRMLNDDNLKDILFEAFSGIKDIKEEVLNKAGEKKVKIRKEKIMPNYVFVKAKLSNTAWSILTNITGVSALLCVSGIPVSTPEEKIEHIKEMLMEGA